jgi:hypothetical protein
MESMPQVTQQRALSITQIATGIAILVFWLLFFTVGMAPAKPPPCYFAFEHAFPLPDTILAIALVASGVNVLKGGIWGHGVSLACAGGLLFLGVLDFSFTAQNGGFSGPIIEALQSGIITLWCAAVGLWIVAVHGTGSRTATFTEL